MFYIIISFSNLAVFLSNSNVLLTFFLMKKDWFYKINKKNYLLRLLLVARTMIRDNKANIPTPPRI